MAKTYYDSEFTGAQIDAAIKTADEIHAMAKTANSGKYIGIDEDGKISALNIPAPDAYDDTELSQRVSDLETALAELADGDEVSY